MKKKQPSPKFIITEKEPGKPDTIGAVFDYYSLRGYDAMPKNATINSTKFKSDKNGR